MTAPARVSYCSLESERLLVYFEAAIAVVDAAKGRRLPATLAAAIHELDRLGAQVIIGSTIYVIESAVPVAADQPGTAGAPT